MKIDTDCFKSMNSSSEYQMNGRQIKKIDEIIVLKS